MDAIDNFFSNCHIRVAQTYATRVLRDTLAHIGHNGLRAARMHSKMVQLVILPRWQRGFHCAQRACAWAVHALASTVQTSWTGCVDATMSAGMYAARLATAVGPAVHVTCQRFSMATASYHNHVLHVPRACLRAMPMVSSKLLFFSRDLMQNEHVLLSGLPWLAIVAVYGLAIGIQAVQDACVARASALESHARHHRAEGPVRLASNWQVSSIAFRSASRAWWRQERVGT
jgi:hypothetical protein